VERAVLPPHETQSGLSLRGRLEAVAEVPGAAGGHGGCPPRTPALRPRPRGSRPADPPPHPTPSPDEVLFDTGGAGVAARRPPGSAAAGPQGSGTAAALQISPAAPDLAAARPDVPDDLVCRHVFSIFAGHV